ncbi:MAG: hypothetical protein IKI27_02010, partial [Methanobrevibacter sp.]|nr:hypothetical protein [Methanobrevibacter sp.]
MLSVFLILFFTIGAVSASDNSTLSDDADVISSGEDEVVMEDGQSDSNDVSTPIANESIKTSLQS